jgi:diguanylate cyclase (GGDEF)-like protein
MRVPLDLQQSSQRAVAAAALATGPRHLLSRLGPQHVQGSSSGLRSRTATVDRLSILDPATGFFNRRFAFDYLPNELHRADRQDHTLTLVLIEFDDVREAVACEGESTLDSALSDFALRLKAAIRPTDLPVRMTTDQFMLVLRGCDFAQTLQMLSHLPSHIVAGKSWLSLSVGLARHREGEIAAELLYRADEDLYRTKTRRASADDATGFPIPWSFSDDELAACLS